MSHVVGRDKLSSMPSGGGAAASSGGAAAAAGGDDKSKCRTAQLNYISPLFPEQYIAGFCISEFMIEMSLL